MLARTFMSRRTPMSRTARPNHRAANWLTLTERYAITTEMLPAPPSSRCHITRRRPTGFRCRQTRKICHADGWTIASDPKGDHVCTVELRLLTRIDEVGSGPAVQFVFSHALLGEAGHGIGLAGPLRGEQEA